MSALRYLSRDGKIVLQQQENINCEWEDVPVHDDPEGPWFFGDRTAPEEPEYVICNVGTLAKMGMEIGPQSVVVGPDVRLIDERLVNKLVKALEASAFDRTSMIGSIAADALAHYRKHVPVKK